MWTSIRISSLLEMSEVEYRRWLSAIEADPLYQRLRAWPGGPIVRREPRPGARFAWGARAAGEVESVASAASLPGLDPQVAGWIRRLGLQAFERAFLRSDNPAARLEAALAAGLTPEQAEGVGRIVDSAELLRDAESVRPPLSAPVHCVAAFEREGPGWAVAYFSPHYLRGRYRVDYAALAAARAQWSAGDWGRLRELLGRLELANRKISALGRVLEALPGLQPEFIGTGDPGTLKPLRQNAAVKELALSPSALCRALAGRSVLLPRGREVELAAFFPSPRWRTSRLVAELAAQLPEATDEELRLELKRRHGVVVTRRLVSLRRAEAEAGA